ncbi:MAG: twin-arginine translocation signal domain-containing protein [Planctomycetota bacterium]
MKNQETKDNRQHRHISRRGFVKATAAATAAFTIVPRHVLGATFSEPKAACHRAIGSISLLSVSVIWERKTSKAV